MPSPDNMRIEDHTREMQKWWQRPDYIKERKAFVKRRPACDRCGRKATTPGHAHEDYRDYETYKNAVVTDKCESLCNPCNKAERAGKRPCPECVKKYHAGLQDTIHYIPQNREICAYCEDPDFIEKAKAKKNKRNRDKNAHDRRQYRKYHPKKVVRNGQWVIIGGK